MSALLFLAALATKHFLADFMWQTPWMMADKHRFGAVGGVSHAALHGALTGIVGLFFLPLGAALTVAALDAALHYAIDYTKARAQHARSVGPEDAQYWAHFGLDQLAHQMCYILIVALFVAA